MAAEMRLFRVHRGRQVEGGWPVFFLYVSSVASPASPASPAAAIVAISPALRRCRLDGASAPARNERPPAG